MKSKFIFLLAGYLVLSIPCSLHAESLLKIKKATWDQKRLKLEVKAKAPEASQLTVLYGDRQFLMNKNGDSEFSLKVEPICYYSEVLIKNDASYTAKAPVQVKNSSGAVPFCNFPGSSPGTGIRGDVVVIANNDLGMHCVCPGASTFLLLPPFNTIRAQVFERRGEEPRLLTNPGKIKVQYSILENSDDSLKADPYFKDWMENAPKIFPGYQPVRPDGRIQGLTGATLSGEMDAQNGSFWEAKGIPAFPALNVANGANMTDPFGGPNRKPYLTAAIKVFDRTSGKLLAETTTLIPTAFGGCCGCHLKLASERGFPATARGSFELMGMLHEKDSGINISKIDIDGDGIGGPVRCSWCHLDPAMGETSAPGVPNHPEYSVSSKTLSEVVHGFHAKNKDVLAMDPKIATDCYRCHPGNGIECYRGHHTQKALWCTDCHGDLNQRIKQGQLKKPWSDQTLPTCSKCHGDVGEGSGYLDTGIFGAYLNSRGHKGKVLCSTCHGEPHALYPSNLEKDNVQMVRLQGINKPLGKCDVCHAGEGGFGKPPHDKGGFSSTISNNHNANGNQNVVASSELKGTCLSCHGDKSQKVSCSNGKWLAHNGSRVSSTVFDAVSRFITGKVCGATSSSGQNRANGNLDALSSLCLSCHSDKSRKVSCKKKEWLKHRGTRVSTTIFDNISRLLTGNVCTTNNLIGDDD